MDRGVEESDVLPKGPHMREDGLAVATGHLAARVDVHVLLKIGGRRKGFVANRTFAWSVIWKTRKQ